MNRKPLQETAVCWLMLLLIAGLRLHFTNVLSENEAKLTAEIRQLKTLMQHLNSSKDVSTLPAAIQNRSELRTQGGKSTGQPRDMEANVSRAQWSIDASCPKSIRRRCQPCQNGWHYFQSSCYVMLHPDPPDWKN